MKNQINQKLLDGMLRMSFDRTVEQINALSETHGEDYRNQLVDALIERMHEVR